MEWKIRKTANGYNAELVEPGSKKETYAVFSFSTSGEAKKYISERLKNPETLYERIAKKQKKQKRYKK